MHQYPITSQLEQYSRQLAHALDHLLDPRQRRDCVYSQHTGLQAYPVVQISFLANFKFLLGFPAHSSNMTFFLAEFALRVDKLAGRS